MTAGTKEEPSKNAALVKDDPGMQYVKRPYEMTLEKEKELLEEARNRVQVLLKNDVETEDFHSRVTYHGVKVSQKKDGAFCIAKGTTDVPEGMTLQDVRKQFDSDFRNSEVAGRICKRIDPMVLQMTIVSELQHKELLDESKHEKLRILWGPFYVAPLVSDRDFLFVQHTLITKCPVTGQDVYVSNSFSVELPDVVPDMEKSLGRVRAILKITGYVFRPHPTLENQLSMSFMGQADPRGYLPAAIVNLASVSQALNAGRVRDIYEHFIEVQKLMPGAEFPFDSYHLGRRGGIAYHAVPLVPPQEGAKTFHVHLRVHSEHDITVQAEGLLTDATLSAMDKDTVGEDLVAGKEVTFGGKKVLDVVLQVTLEDGRTEELSLLFTNPNWKKTIVSMAATMPISMVNPKASADEIAATAEQ